MTMLMASQRAWFSSLVLPSLIVILSCASAAHAWGVSGHQIVATIAQTQLHPDVRAHLCTILPPEQTAYRSFYPKEGAPHQHCHLAPLSAWADRVHGQYPWASHLHYINPVQDDPPKHCTYGENGWQDHGTGNVLEAIVNFTSALQTKSGYERDIALRFLIHFMGDSHQPLHLTGRARGGNDVHVRFNGRFARLHTVWDSLLLNDQIRDVANYTTRLPSTRIESALLGRTYDAYIRWIMAEGLGQAQGANGHPGWWHEESESWTYCPEEKVESGKHGKHNKGAHWLRAITPHSTKLAQRVYATIFRKLDHESQVQELTPSNVDDTDLPVCPYAWTKPMHPLVCSYAFADPVPPFNQSDHGPLAELNVPEYAGRVHDHKIIHRQLARAGIRLAAVLNTLLLPEAQKAKGGMQDMADPDLAVQVHRILVAEDNTIERLSTLEEFEEPSKGKHGKHGGHHNGSDGGKSGQSPIWSLIKVTAASIAEVIILSSIGYILARQGVLDKRTQTKINKVNVSFFTPALLFSKVAFSLDPGRLAELIIVPAGFVIITVVSGLSAMLLSSIARLSRSQRNFTIACAITPNSNSLPVALMQSLVVTVPQLHWEEDGEPEDTMNGMLGRALTYLVLFSTLGMFLRWSLASQLLSTMEEDPNDTRDEEPVTGVPATTSQPPTGRLIDHESEDTQQGVHGNAKVVGPQDLKQHKQPLPQINVRRSTEEGGGVESIETRPHRRQSGWPRSFPNSPGDSEDDEEDENTQGITPRWQQRQSNRSCTSSLKQFNKKYILRPYKAVTAFMTMPLYAALISLIVALIPPLQALISSIEPLVGALETAGACSIPLTMVVLGAYFYQEADPKTNEGTKATTKTTTTANNSTDHTSGPSSLTASTDTVWRRSEGEESANATLVDVPNTKRKSIPFMRNPWKTTSASEGNSANGSTNGDDFSETGDANASSRRTSVASRKSLLSPQERKEKQRETMERRTIAVAIASRMFLTPILLLPLLAWYAIATRFNVVDDPVFICSACLLIGSPPALTLAQITSQNAKGSDGSFERLISKTIFVAYAIMATPTTIVLVLTALVIAENDH